MITKEMQRIEKPVGNDLYDETAPVDICNKKGYGHVCYATLITQN